MPLSLAEVQSMTANLSGMAYAALPLWAPSRATPYQGPSFNNPTKGRDKRRRNLERIVKMVRATPGYRVRSPRQCPRVPQQFPAQIKIALYSFSDRRVADALISAHRRCVSVQVLINNHLSNRDVPAFGRLQKNLGWRVGTRSWARRCRSGCRGGIGPLHTKLFMFSRAGRARNVVTVGSSNMTGKAAGVQWNDLLVVHGRPRLWDQSMVIFTEMARDRNPPPPMERNYADGPFYTMWWPQPRHTYQTDRVMRALRQVRCGVRPTGGTGYAGRTAIAVNIHAMEGERGLYIARYLARMKRAGCRVRVLYGLIAPRINRLFKSNGVPSRRTIFDRSGDDHADYYSHMKMLTVNGVYGSVRNQRLVFTGSENFSQKAIGGDEVWLRVPSSRWWRRYQDHFDMIWNSSYYSSKRYAWYSQSDTPIHARQATPPGSIKVTREDLEG
jgi:phosphatidylserine/phosphatidylglycerophosphate/cardiolipin synthase-like enzyme